jgi:hypothetical protein
MQFALRNNAFIATHLTIFHYRLLDRFATHTMTTRSTAAGPPAYRLRRSISRAASAIAAASYRYSPRTPKRRQCHANSDDACGRY